MEVHKDTVKPVLPTMPAQQNGNVRWTCSLTLPAFFTPQLACGAVGVSSGLQEVVRTRMEMARLLLYDDIMLRALLRQKRRFVICSISRLPLPMQRHEILDVMWFAATRGGKSL